MIIHTIGFVPSGCESNHLKDVLHNVSEVVVEKGLNDVEPLILDQVLVQVCQRKAVISVHPEFGGG
jgi:hypothetical protein